MAKQFMLLCMFRGLFSQPPLLTFDHLVTPSDPQELHPTQALGCNSMGDERLGKLWMFLCVSCNFYLQPPELPFAPVSTPQDPQELLQT